MQVFSIRNSSYYMDRLLAASNDVSWDWKMIFYLKQWFHITGMPNYRKRKKKKKATQNSSHQIVLKLFLLVVYISWFVYFIVECKPFFLTVVVRFRSFAKWSRLWRIRKGNASWGSVPGKEDQDLAGRQGRTWVGDVFEALKISGRFCVPRQETWFCIIRY